MKIRITVTPKTHSGFSFNMHAAVREVASPELMANAIGNATMEAIDNMRPRTGPAWVSYDYVTTFEEVK